MTEAMQVLVEGLTAQGRGSADPDGLLRAAARALLGVAQRFEGRELMVSVGPDHDVAVRIRDDGVGPKVEVVTRRAAGVVPTPSASAPAPPVATPRSSAGEPGQASAEPRPEAATELADLLRRREVARW